MEATLKFNLPEESTEHLWAVGAPLMARHITDLAEETRGWLKHGHDFRTPDQVIEAVRARLHEVLGLARGEFTV
jgi:hypothetical protein